MRTDGEFTKKGEGRGARLVLLQFLMFILSPGRSGMWLRVHCLGV